MDLPARRDDEDLHKLALAPNDGPHYLQHSDGTWWLVRPDGWPVSPDEYAELHADSESAIATAPVLAINVEPISVQDSEIR